jgi:hypothetical protein
MGAGCSGNADCCGALCAASACAPGCTIP